MKSTHTIIYLLKSYTHNNELVFILKKISYFNKIPQKYFTRIN